MGAVAPMVTSGASAPGRLAAWRNDGAGATPARALIDNLMQCDAYCIA